MLDEPVAPKPTANPALEKAAALASARLQQRSLAEAKLEFAKRTPEDVRKYVGEIIEEGKVENRRLATSILIHKEGEDISNLPGVKPVETQNMKSDDIIGSLLGDVESGERYGVFDMPSEVTEVSATQRQIKADDLARREGILSEIILHQLKSGEASQAVKLLSRFTAALHDRPEAVPQRLAINLAHRLEELADPSSETASKESLLVIRDLTTVSKITEIVPGFSDFSRQIENKIQAIEVTEAQERTKREEKAKAEKHMSRESSLEEDTIDGSMKTAEDNFETKSGISNKKEITLGEGKEGFSSHLEVVLESPLIKKALSEAGLTADKLTDPIGQLDSLLTIQASPSLMDEAVRALETVGTDWTGWTRADYEQAKQGDRWEHNWRNHLENTIYGYALGIVESAGNEAPGSNRVLVIQRAMDILLGDASFGIDITGDDSIFAKFGKDSNRSNAVIRFANIISEKDEALLGEIIDGEISERPRMASVKDRLANLSSAEEARSQTVRAEQERFKSKVQEIEQAERDFGRIFDDVEIAMYKHQLFIDICDGKIKRDPNDYLQVVWKKGSMVDGSKPIDVPTLIIKPSFIEGIDRQIAGEKANLERLERNEKTPHQNILASKRRIASAEIRKLTIQELQKDADRLLDNIRYTSKGKYAYMDIGTLFQYDKGRAATSTEHNQTQEMIAPRSAEVTKLLDQLREHRGNLARSTSEEYTQKTLRAIERISSDIKGYVNGIRISVNDLNSSVYIERIEQILIKDALLNGQLDGVRGTLLNASKTYFQNEVDYSDPTVRVL